MDISGEGFQTKKSLGNYTLPSYALNMPYPEPLGQVVIFRLDILALYSNLSLCMLTVLVKLQVQALVSLSYSLDLN